MMQATVHLVVTCSSTMVNDFQRRDPYPIGEMNVRDVLVKGDFKPVAPGRRKRQPLVRGARLEARAPKWALNPVTARVVAEPGFRVLSKTGGSPDGTWANIGIRPTFEWCLVVQSTVTGPEPREVDAMLVAFIPNGGDVDAHVYKVVQSFSIADLARLSKMLTSPQGGREGGASGGPTNVGPPNVGPPNVGPPNVGPTNVGPPNVGPPNVGPPNVGPPNVGPPNVGPPNVGPPNVGPPNVRPPAPPSP